MAMGWAALGETDRAFVGLERAFQVRSAGLIYLHVDPGYEPLQDRSPVRSTGGADRVALWITETTSLAYHNYTFRFEPEQLLWRLRSRDTIVIIPLEHRLAPALGSPG